MEELLSEDVTPWNSNTQKTISDQTHFAKISKMFAKQRAVKFA